MLNDVHSGVGVKTRLHDAQRHSWTISIFLRRVPFRVIAVLPQWAQRPGRFSVCGTRAAREIVAAILDKDEILTQTVGHAKWTET
jgi:hypothetical protein